MSFIIKNIHIVVIPTIELQASPAIRGFDYSREIDAEPNPCFCSKPGLALCGFAIHIKIFCE